MDTAELAMGLGYTFWNQKLLGTALTHSSWVNEQASEKDGVHNERLEFLGDAVLELCVTEVLYRRFSSMREGEMTRLRSGLVNTTTLAALARLSGVREYLKLGHGEEAQGGRDRDPLLADAMEAVIGAAYLDGGLAAARQVVEKLYRDRWPDGPAAAAPPQKDYKTLLQEKTQRLDGLARGLPVYAADGMEGPEHAPVFAAVVTLPDGRHFRGSSGNRRGAEQAAAKAALEALETEK